MFWAENYRCWNQVLYIDTLCPLNCPVWDNFIYSFLHDKISSCIPCCLRHISPCILPTHLLFLCPLVMDLESSLSQSTHLNRRWWQRFLNPRPSVGLEWTVAIQNSHWTVLPSPEPPILCSLLFLQGCKVIGSHNLSFWSFSLTEATPNKSTWSLGRPGSLPMPVCCCHFPFCGGISFS